MAAMKIAIVPLLLAIVKLSASSTHRIIPIAVQYLGDLGSNCVVVASSFKSGDHTVLKFDETPVVNYDAERLEPRLFSLCGGIVVELPKDESSDAFLSVLPAKRRIIFITEDIKRVEKFPKLRRLPLTQYFSSIHNQTTEHNVRFKVYKREGYHSDTLGQVAYYNGETFVKMPSSMEMDFAMQTDFGGNDFPAVAFEFFPYSMPDFETGEHKGFEYQIVKAIADSLNLKLVVNPPTTGGMWGWEKEDGNFTGLLGDFQHSAAEIGWANLFITRTRLNIMEFSSWYLSDPSCFLYKRTQPHSGIALLVFPLQRVVWMLVVLTLLSVAIFYLLLSVLGRDRNVSLGRLLIYEAAVTLEVSTSSSRILSSGSVRVLNAFFILGMMVLTASYSGSLVSFFSVKLFPREPRSIADMAKFVRDNDLDVHVCCNHINETMMESSSDSFKTMTEENRIVPYVEGHFTSALQDTDAGKQIYVYPQNGLEILRRTNMHEVPYNNLRIMRDCFFPTQIGLGLSLNSPFKAVVDRKLILLRESGIVDKLVRDGHDMVGRVEEEGDGGGGSAGNSVLTLENVLGIFQIFLIFIAVAILAFVCERCVVPTLGRLSQMERRLHAMSDKRELFEYAS